MLKKRKTRELALRVMFLWDANGTQDLNNAWQTIDDALTEARIAAELVRGVPLTESEISNIRLDAMFVAVKTWERRSETDVWVERLAPQWPPRRQPGVDRNLIRLGVWELTNTDTPPKVVIDEAIELAKQFSTEQSPAFVNGVLDAVLKERRLVAGD